MTTFSQWKKPFLKDRICKNKKDVNVWLKMHGITEIPSSVSKYTKWICKSNGLQKVCLIRYKLILHIKGFKKPYRRVIISMFPIKFMIKREYFNIFGNTCKIIRIDKRTIERTPLPNLSTQQTVISAFVQSQYKEERSGHKITNFYLNTKKNNTMTPIKNQNSKTKLVQPLQIKSNKLSLTDLKQKYRWSTPSYHKKLIHHFTEGLKRDIEKPRLVLMFGLPGSGKNWVLEKRRKRDHVIINMDDCLAMLPDYWRGMLELQERDKRAHDWIQTFREECRSIANQLFRFALDNRMNIVWNGTGKNMSKYKKLITMSKEKGYIVELNGIWVPLKVAKKRLTERRESYGRPVPQEVFDLAVLNIPTTFKNLRVDADYARIWKNELCMSPRIIWDKQQGWIGETKIKNNMDWIMVN